MKNIIATKIIKPRLRNILLSLLILSAVFLPYSGTSLGQKSVAKAAGSTSLVISRIQIIGGRDSMNSPTPGNPKNQYIELYNPTPTPIVMTNWRLTRKDSSGVEANLVANLSGTVVSHGYFLIVDADGYNGTTAKDVQYSNPNNLLKSDNTVLLYLSNEVSLVDKVGWGDAKDYESQPSRGGIGEGGSLLRLPADGINGNGIDTNNNDQDFKGYLPIISGPYYLAPRNSRSPIEPTFASVALPAGDVVDAPEDGSWDPDHLIDFPNGQVSAEEKALNDQTQAAMDWWKNAFTKATLNCYPNNYRVGQFVYWSLGAIMKKVCWQTDIGTGQDNSLLTELYTTYWPDQAGTNLTGGSYNPNASGLFVGTQAWISNPALVNGLDGPNGPTNPSPARIDALDAVHNAGWGIEADRLLAVFQAMPNVSAGSVMTTLPHSDEEMLTMLMLIAPIPGIKVAEVFIAKVTKTVGTILLTNTKTGLTYVVKVVDAAVAKRLTNRALSTATSAELNTLVVKEVANAGSQAVTSTTFERTVNATTKKFTGWKAVASDAKNVLTLDSSWFKLAKINVEGTNFSTLIRRSGFSLFMDVGVDAAIGGKLTFNLTKMFPSGTGFTLSQQRYIATGMARGLSAMLKTEVISQGIPKSLGVINKITRNIIIDNSAAATEAYVSGGTGGWAGTDGIHLIYECLKERGFDPDLINTFVIHEATHKLNYAAMAKLGTESYKTRYSKIKIVGKMTFDLNPINEGLTQFLTIKGSPSGYSSSAYRTYERYWLTVSKLRDVLCSRFEQLYPMSGLNGGQVEAFIDKSIVNAYIKYGPAAFDFMIETQSGAFSSQTLSDMLFAAGRDTDMTGIFAYIKGINITKINIIPPATF